MGLLAARAATAASERNNANAFPVIAVVKAPTVSTFDEAMYVPTGGLAVTGGPAAP